MKNRFSFLAMLLTGLVAVPLAQDCAQAIIDDMTLPCDAKPHGTDGLSWGDNCTSGLVDGAVPAKNNRGEWMQAMINWGQVYIPREGSAASNTRCQIRNLTTKALLTDSDWHTLQAPGNPEGAAFVENFANNAAIDAGARDESGNGGGLSMIVGVGLWAGYNYHFWSTGGRVSVDVNTIVAVYTSCEARLIVNDPSKPDDRARCRNILSMGADWWLNTSAGWDPCWCHNFGIGGGRAKWVTSDWQSFSMCTLPPDKLRANPPCETFATHQRTRFENTHPIPIGTTRTVQVFNLLGKNIRNARLSPNDRGMSAGFTGLIPGLYIAKINSNGQLHQMKIVEKKK